MKDRVYIDPRFADDPFIRAATEASHPGAEILPHRRPRAFKTELTPIGEQFVIPGCEQKPQGAKPVQLKLWGG